MSDQMNDEAVVEMPAAAEVQPEAPEAPLLRSVGATLKAAREAAGMSLDDIARTLKLGKKQVDALESDDWDGLPGHTFTRGFVRNYARIVGEDPAPLMAMLDGILAKPVNTLAVPEKAPETIRAAGNRTRDRNMVVAGVVIVLLAAAAYFLLPGSLNALRDDTQSLIDGMARKDEAAPAVAPAPAEPAFPPGASNEQIIAPQAVVAGEPAATTNNEVTATSAGAAAPAAVADVPPQLRVLVTQPSWLEVRDKEGAVVFSQRLDAGTEQTVSGKAPLSVTVGFAPGVQLFSRGERVDLTPFAKGDVARLVLE